MGLFSGIFDTIGGLFGGGSNDRQAQRAGNNAGAALTQEQQYLQQMAPWLAKQGNAAGLSAQALNGYLPLLTQANGDLNNQSGALGQQSTELGMQNAALGQQANLLNQSVGTVGAQQAALGQSANSLDAQRAQIGQMIQAALGQGQLGSMMAGGFGQYFPGALGAMMANSGLNPDGTANASFDPYGNGVGDQMISTYADKATAQGDKLVSTANRDLGARGFGGGPSALGDSQIGDIRRGQTSDVQNFTRQLGVQGAQEKYNRQGSAINALMGLGQGAGGLFGNAGGAYGSAASALGNNAGGYDNIAGGFGNIGSLFGNAASGFGNVASGYANGANGYGNVAQGYGNLSGGRQNIAQGLGQLSSLWGGVGNNYGNVAQGYGGIAGGFGQIANGYNGQQQMANQGKANNSAGIGGLVDIAKLFI